LSGARTFGSGAPNRSASDFALDIDFNGLDIVLHVLRAPVAQRIGCFYYATDGLQM
jgi:hypothetical protein